jgi:hypothetical protein
MLIPAVVNELVTALVMLGSSTDTVIDVDSGHGWAGVNRSVDALGVLQVPATAGVIFGIEAPDGSAPLKLTSTGASVGTPVDPVAGVIAETTVTAGWLVAFAGTTLAGALV